MAPNAEKSTKRNTNRGVRIVGRRIYDSKNGKSCHQCRQKTRDFVATCKAIKKNRQCTFKYCHNCLLLGYAEKAEQVETLPDWICPQCRGICQCSVCRASRGLKPTGILSHKAKACGYTSVLEFLQATGFDENQEKLDVASMEGCSESVPETEVEIAGESSESIPQTGMEVAGESSESVPQTEVEVAGASSESVPETEMEVDGQSSECVPQTKVEVAGVAKEKKKQVVRKPTKARATKKLKEEIQFEAPLPQGISLTSMSGIDIPSEEAGNVCQLFEFCSAFGEALGLMEGQAETVVRELFVCGRNIKRQQYSSVIQMMIQLLNLISQDTEMSLSLNATDNSWFAALGEILLQSEVSSDEFPPETFRGDVAEYTKMDASKRLKLLNFLCDESLNTWAMRNYIISQTKEYEIQKKEAKKKATAATKKDKEVKQKLQSDVAIAILEKNGAPLSIEEHNSILSQIRAEAEEAHDEMMVAKGIVSATMLKCAALGTDPIMMDDNGIVLWKLKCYKEEPSFLLQDLGSSECPHEKWLAFKPEQKQEIEKYISSKMRKLMKTQKKNADVAHISEES